MTLHDVKGDALCTSRYGRMPQGDIEGLCTALCDDVLAMLRRSPALLVVLLCDGAKELWNRLGAEFTKESLGQPVYRLVDLWHLLEKLGTAARLLYGDKEGASTLAKWRLKLLNEDSALEQILQTLQDSGKQQVRVGDGRPVHEAITYLENPPRRHAVRASPETGPAGRLGKCGIDLRALALSDRYEQAITRALDPLRRLVSPVLTLPAVLSCAA